MNKHNLKKAVLDQIILWIVLFIMFVSFLFFIIDYSNVIKVKDNTDALADYMARRVALNSDVENYDLASSLNNVKASFFNDIQNNDITCTTSINENYQIIVNIYTTINNSFLPVSSDNVHSKVVIFGENDSFDVECNLTLTFK